MIKPKTRHKNIVVQEFENEVLIYDLLTNKAYCLNETSAMIWQLCDGKNSVADIANLLSRQMNELITEDFVWLALDGLKKEKLLEESEKFAINYNGLSRRQVIKRIGVASMTALPLVSSIVAPQAAMAQSGGNRPLFASCSSPSQCASGRCPTTNCCAGDGFVLTGAGINGCNNSTVCTNNATVVCCSGTATFTVTNCSGIPGNGSCICN